MFKRGKQMKVRRDGVRSRGPVVAREITSEDEGDGGVVRRQLRNNGVVAAQRGEVR